jgi:hypothetical protein
MFNCLRLATIVGNLVRLSDLATTDSTTIWLLSAPDEPSVAGLVEVNWVTTIVVLTEANSLGEAHGRESPRHDHRALPLFAHVFILTTPYASATLTDASLWVKR